MHDRSVCTAIRSGNRDCDAPIPAESPVSLCWEHLIQAYVFVGDKLDEPPLISPEGHRRGQLSTQYVYYLRFGDRVKIGTTSNLVTRFQAIPHDEVLAVEPGGVELERQRHNEFAAHHIKGEWYVAAPELLAHAYRLFLAQPGLVP